MGSRVSDLLSAGRSDRSAVHDSVAATGLDAAIADARNRVEELDRLRTAAAERLLELTRLRGAQPDRGAPNDATEYSPAAKLRIFRGLFGGRDDVFAVRWDNSAQNRAGYAPRCANEWQRGVCGKPKVKCGTCGNQAFLTLDDRQLLAHLQGRQVVGLYPDDDYLIALARIANADYLVSGDRHLLDLAEPNPPVLTSRQFLDLLGA